MAPGDPMARPRSQLPQMPTSDRKHVPVTPTSTALDERQLRDLHSRLMRARDQTGDQTRVSVEALAKTVDAAAAKLRQQHGHHRRIDFDVVIKDGKAVVRPIVR
jgi:phosphoribosyl-dephospho-CoA transferase